LVYILFFPMMNLIYVIVINISLGGILFTIFLTSMLNKRYRLPFLSSYLYFQIFLAIFGTYGILVPGVIRNVLLNQDISLSEVENICHFFTFLGVPFLILSLYMFLRCNHELVETKLPPWITLTYFLICFLLFIGYGVILYFFQDFSYQYFPLIPRIIRIALAGLGFLLLIYGVLATLFKSDVEKNHSRKKALARFGSLNLIVFTSVITLLLLVDTNPYLGAAFIFLFFNSSILPLLSIRSYLIQSIPVPESKLDSIGNIEQFISLFGISKREEEIIKQICLGRSNKEISEGLFITLQTVKDHVYRIFLKTGVKNRIQLSNLIRKLSAD